MVSIANLHFLPVKTQTTLKSPLEGHNLGPFHKPEEFLGRAMDNLTHEDWETNVNGMHTGYIEIFMQGKCGRDTETTFELKRRFGIHGN